MPDVIHKIFRLPLVRGLLFVIGMIVLTTLSRLWLIPWIARLVERLLPGR